jgi:tripartite-type tricarboxylate transporter receptor subunit TctC
MVGGHIDAFYGGVAVSKSTIDSGLVKALAISGDARSAALPNVPTFKEAGVPEFDLASWTVMLAPKGTPADIVALLRKEVLLALDDPKVRGALARQGVEKSATQDVSAFLKAEYEKYGRTVHALGIVMGQ